jgi:hypothetical protein
MKEKPVEHTPCHPETYTELAEVWSGSNSIDAETSENGLMKNDYRSTILRLGSVQVCELVYRQTLSLCQLYKLS